MLYMVVRMKLFLPLLLFVLFCTNPKKEDKMDKGNIRRPAVAGAFYPGNLNELQKEVDGFLESAKKEEIEGKIVGIICPHAGYPYSGAVAARSFKQIEDETVDAVILIGPSHRAYFEGLAVYDKGGWETPLGTVDIDKKLAKDLIVQNKAIRADPSPHIGEHSIEVQIPFLQRVKPNAKIVPVMMCEQNEQNCKILGDAIANVAKDKDVLILASSDLYHGYSYEECVKTDKRTLSYIKKMNPDGLLRALATSEAQACGGGPIVSLLFACRKLGAESAKLLRYTNSADVAGSKGGYVVGYSSFCIYKSESKTMHNGGTSEGLSEEEKKELIRIARETIEHKIKGKPIPKFTPLTKTLEEERGVFVTLKKDGQLRGCIGYIQPIKPLYQAVPDMAVQSSTADPRFPSVTEEELKKIEIEISVLTVPVRAKVEEIVLGKHGVIVKRGYNQGVFLPQVATETGWTKEEFLSNLCSHKAGLSPDEWKDKETELYIFSAEVFSEKE